ncbi:MAG: hypothetical protein FJW37_13120 [Acidobacteria bacterium]|nr:hypothetical protein [Acidobacteriota bacterium]
MEDFERCSLAVQEFLGVPPRAALKSRLRKQRRWTRRDGILNYQELYEHIASRCEACVAFFEEEEP